MSKQKTIWKAFNAGELTPWLDGQVAFEKYYSGCKMLRNMIPTVQGPALSRPGFRFVAKTKYPNKECRLIQFDFSIEQAYILEVGDLYIRFYKDRGQILDSGVPYEIATPYTEAQLHEIQFIQSNDVLYISHPDHKTAMISRTGHTAWTFTYISFIKQYTPTKSMLSTSGFDNFNAEYCVDDQYTTKAWDNNTDGVGQWMQIDTGSSNKKRFTRIALYIDGSALNAIYDVEYYDTADATWKKAVTGWDLSGEPIGWAIKDWASVGSFAKWRLYKTNAASAGGNVMGIELYEVGMPSSWNTGTYPSSIAFYEQRLWYGNKERVWASKTGDFYNLTTGINGDDAIEYTIASQEVNKIQWIASGKILVIGTAGGEYKVSASSLEEAITPANIRIAKQSNIGSDYSMPVPVGDIVLYLQRSKRKLREFSYNTLEDAFTSPDMTVLCRHLFNSDVKYLSYQQEPYSVLWCVMDDGTLNAFTYQRPEGITAWSKHITNGTFESAASIYGQNGNNELWVVVKRTIQGQTARHIEYLEEPYDGEDITTDTGCFYVDSGLTYNGVAARRISGLDHLEGETVSILADGVVLNSQKVTNGSIFLAEAASIVHAGLPYDQMLQTMRIESPDTEGTSQGRAKYINRCTIRLYKTLSLQYGSLWSNLKTKTFESPYSGDFELNMPAGWSKDGYVVIKNSSPTPIGIVAIIPEIYIS